MARLLFRMRNVPDDEAREVRELLEANDIEYFETTAGNWGISMPALWLKQDEDFSTARRLLDEYQSARAIRVRHEYELQRQRGEARTWRDSFMEDPVRFVLYMGLIVAVLFISLRFFLSF